MKTVGEIIKHARQASDISLIKVASDTKIRVSYLRAIEADDFSQFQSKVILRGLIKNYAEYLGINSESILAVFKRDFIDKNQCQPRIGSAFCWTPKHTMISIATLTFLLITAYLVWQYLSLQSAPY